jgi:chromate transport protein ChrA
MKLLMTQWEEMAFAVGFIVGAFTSAFVAYMAVTLSALVVMR